MRIVGVNIPDNKKALISLTAIYGIGQMVSRRILTEARVDPEKKTKELTHEEVARIQGAIDKNYKVEGALRQSLKQNIDRLKEIKAYRGLRHIKKLPVRGQRTKTNSRTVRGNVRKTAGSGKKKLEKK